MKIREYLIEHGKTYTVPRTQKGEKLIICIDGDEIDTPIVNHKIMGIVGEKLIIFVYKEPHELEIIRSYMDKEKELSGYKKFIKKMAKSERIISQAYYAVENKKKILTHIDNAIESFKRERDNWQGKARSYYHDLDEEKKRIIGEIKEANETLGDGVTDHINKLNDTVAKGNQTSKDILKATVEALKLKNDIDREKQEIEQIKKDNMVLLDKIETRDRMLSKRGDNALTLFKQQKEALNKTLADVTKEFTQIATKRKIELLEPLDRVTLIDRGTGKHHTLTIVNGVLDIE